MSFLPFAYFLYNLLLILCLPFVAIGIALRWFRRLRKNDWEIGLRFGCWPEQASVSFYNDRWIWVHVASFGELKAVVPFLEQARDALGARVLLTLMTPEALAWAREHALADRIYPAPFDFPWVVKRLFRLVRPLAMVFVESDFWPNWLRQGARTGVPIFLINGRMSVRSAKRYRLAREWLKPFWAQFTECLVREEQDQRHFIEAGMPTERLHILGQLKYDSYHPVETPFSDDGFVKFLVGSSREGEEALLVPIFLKLQKKYPRMRWVVAPRHLQRLNDVESVCRRLGVRVARKTAFTSWQDVDGMLWDTFGDLVAGYSQADCIVIGGSFSGKGGQNPIEAGAVGRSIVMGPSMENFQSVADRFIQGHAAQQCSLDTLEACLESLIKDPASRRAMGRAALEVVRSEQGATQRTLTFIKTWITNHPTS